MVDTDVPSSARLIAGRYRLGSRLGSSLEAAVFEAFDEQLQRTVVLKLVHPDLSDVPQLQRFFQSALPVAAAMHHPNIAVLHDWGTARWNERDVLFVATERLIGGSLRDLLDRGRLLSPSQALVVGLDACKALDALHRQGLIHTDVRPSTLVFGDDRRLRLVDVGLAQVLHDTVGDITARSMDRAKYSSPEEAQGLPLQPKSDVYSLCLTLLEAVTGRVPFEGESTVATLANRVDRLMPVSADFGQLAAVLERAGRPSVDDRYTAAGFGRALVQSAEQMPRPAPVPILANSLFSPDLGSADQPVDPTGPLARPLPPAPIGEALATDADPFVAAIPVVGPYPVLPPPVAGVAVPLPPPGVAPVAGPPAIPETPAEPVPPPPAANTEVLPQQSVDDEFDPADEFPEHPPALGGGRRWFIALLVVMAVGGGVLAWYNTRPDTSEVPDLRGMRQGEALNQIGPFKGMITEEASETVAAGVVIRTEPAAGTTMEDGSKLNIFVSTGPAPRALPELVGLTLPEATAKLVELGLVIIEADPAYDEIALLGVVVSWSVPAAPTLTAGATVTKGTTVQVVASLGPAPRTVPDLTALPLADATAALQALGLVIAQVPDEFSSAVPVGAVLRQDVAPGTGVARDSTVTVAVSKGPDLIAIPDLTGLDHNGIVAALQAAGFAAGAVTGDTTQAFLGATVSGTPIVVGQQFVRGTAVDLAFAPTPTTTTTTL